MLFSLLKHHLDLNITDTALKVSRSLYCFTTSISHGVENYFPTLWGTGISDAIFFIFHLLDSRDSLSRVKYSRHFNVGDVVWGESRGFPSWPGKLVHESDVKGHYNGNKLQEGKVREILFITLQ